MNRYPFTYCNASSSSSAGVAADDGCQQPLDATPCDICANKAADQAAFDACVACHASGAVNLFECAGCLEAPTAKAQKRCYQCIANTKFSSNKYYGCSAW
jgi:hypothetical protein